MRKKCVDNWCLIWFIGRMPCICLTPETADSRPIAEPDPCTRFQSLDALHHRLHAFANGVLRTSSRTDIAKTGLPELYALRDTLLRALAEFVKQL